MGSGVIFRGIARGKITPDPFLQEQARTETAAAKVLAQYVVRQLDALRRCRLTDVDAKVTAVITVSHQVELSLPTSVRREDQQTVVLGKSRIEGFHELITVQIRDHRRVQTLGRDEFTQPWAPRGDL